jgi:hypothetical protein
MAAVPSGLNPTPLIKIKKKSQIDKEGQCIWKYGSWSKSSSSSSNINNVVIHFGSLCEYPVIFGPICMLQLVMVTVRLEDIIYQRELDCIVYNIKSQ